mmetsp:Transcript_405/g.1229  ORF Transcript_405/g.1229 Transcript_405/m.1229 type:complete len:231 (+) Transcript_405:210-902(+)
MAQVRARLGQRRHLLHGRVHADGLLQRVDQGRHRRRRHAVFRDDPSAPAGGAPSGDDGPQRQRVCQHHLGGRAARRSDRQPGQARLLAQLAGGARQAPLRLLGSLPAPRPLPGDPRVGAPCPAARLADAARAVDCRAHALHGPVRGERVRVEWPHHQRAAGTAAGQGPGAVPALVWGAAPGGAATSAAAQRRHATRPLRHTAAGPDARALRQHHLRRAAARRRWHLPPHL